MVNALEFRDVTVEYDHHGTRLTAVESLDLKLKPNEVLGVLGPSGCGKSTMVHLAAGFIAPSRGEVLVSGQKVRCPGADRGVVFQNQNLFPWKTVRQNVEFGLRMRGIDQDERCQRAKTLLQRVGLAAFADSYPAKLSLGMQQRVGLARAFATDPTILLMDEPFSSLDAQNAVSMRRLLEELNAASRKSIFFVTHDVDEALLVAERIVILSSRPGKVLTELDIDLPRPREERLRTLSRFGELRNRITDLLLTTQ